METIGLTHSVCPICLGRVPAERIKSGDDVYLRKYCETHGKFQTIIWRGPPDYLSWADQKAPEHPKTALTEIKRGCPYDCGLCPGHHQQICCALIEVTWRCNLLCPVCFANSGQGRPADPSLDELMKRLQMIWDTNGICNIQLSGGEPTVRDDLPELIKRARVIGYKFFQLNTNGLRLSEDPAYALALKAAGLSTVFLQFDGLRDETYRSLRGRELLAVKRRAIENCGLYKLGVVLVPTLVPGINTDQIGDIVRFALEGLPIIRGVHFQPVSYFGRYPEPPSDEDRITLPEVLRALEEQTGGLLKVDDFVPSDCESTLCSFHGDFIYMDDGRLTPVTKKDGCCSEKDRGIPIKSAAIRAQNFVASRWQLHEGLPLYGREKPFHQKDGMDFALHRLKNYRLSITAMAFQDVENMDLERLRYCCVPVVIDNKAIPFCAYNLSARNGETLYRGKGS